MPPNKVVAKMRCYNSCEKALKKNPDVPYDYRGCHKDSPLSLPPALGVNPNCERWKYRGSQASSFLVPRNFTSLFNTCSTVGLYLWGGTGEEVLPFSYVFFGLKAMYFICHLM